MQERTILVLLGRATAQIGVSSCRPALGLLERLLLLEMAAEIIDLLASSPVDDVRRTYEDLLTMRQWWQPAPRAVN